MNMDLPTRYWGQTRKIPFRNGFVVAQQIAPFVAVRVQFPAHDNMISYWLPVLSFNTHVNKDFWIPDIGEQVAVLMDEHDEDGVVLGALPSQRDQTASAPGFTLNQRGTQFSDGTTVVYDRSAHAYKIVIGGGSGPTFFGNTSEWYFKVGGVTVTINSSGVQIAGGTLTCTGDVIAGDPGGNNISLLNHIHTGVYSGTGVTAAPKSGT